MRMRWRGEEGGGAGPWLVQVELSRTTGGSLSNNTHTLSLSCFYYIPPSSGAQVASLESACCLVLAATALPWPVLVSRLVWLDEVVFAHPVSGTCVFFLKRKLP